MLDKMVFVRLTNVILHEQFNTFSSESFQRKSITHSFNRVKMRKMVVKLPRNLLIISFRRMNLYTRLKNNGTIGSGGLKFEDSGSSPSAVCQLCTLIILGPYFKSMRI